MTPLSRELQSLKEAASAATAVESAARALSARIFVECGQDGWLAMAREFAAIRASMALPEERYAAEIASIQGEEADRKEREAILDAEMERKIKDHNEKIAAIVREAREQAGLDAHSPRPGDLLTAAQLRDAPDGTVVRHPHDATLRKERIGGGWHILAASTPSTDVLSDNFWFLVRWGRA